MKAYIGMIDWADEGNVFCYSVYEEEAFDCMYKLFKVLVDLEALPEICEPYWGTNQSFYFYNYEIEELLNEYKYIDDTEFNVLEKLGVDGYDIYGMISDHLMNAVSIYDYDTHKYIFNKKLTKADLEIIKPLYIGLFSEEAWNSIEPNE